MKRIVALILATLLAATVLGSLGTALAVDWSIAYVNTANHKSLYLREDYSKDAPIILSMPYRAQLSVIDFLESDYWAYVNYNGVTGYCMTRYLSTTMPPAGGGGSSGGGGGGESGAAEGLETMFNTFSPSEYYASVRPSTPSGFVNLRWAPTKNAKIRATYYSDQTLLVIADGTNWCQVYDESSKVCGFMMKSFLQVTSGGGSGDVGESG